MPSPEGDLIVLYAGSLKDLVVGELFPRFERLSGYRAVGRGGGSRQWAVQLRERLVQADLLLSADATVNEMELARPGERIAEWYLVFATNELVLAYSAASPVAEQMRAAAEGEGGWVRLLQGGYRLGRPDPDADPKGYRTLFALQLAELRYGLPGLVAEVAGPPRNPAQLFDPAELTGMLQRGEIDLAFAYRSQAEEAGLPYATLPTEINLGSPDLNATYAAASYRCNDGTCYRGAPIAYTATPLVEAPHPLAAAAFLTFLASEEAAQAIRQHHFGVAQRLVRLR